MFMLAVFLLASQTTTATSPPLARPAPSGQNIVLGFSDCSPVLFVVLPPKGLTVAFSKVQYDALGRATAFVEDITVSGDSSTRADVSVSHGANGMCPKTTYKAVVGGQARESVSEGAFKSSAYAGHIGFTVKDIGGAVVIGLLEGGLTTKLAYDSSGRQRLAKQSFRQGGKQYEVKYSNVSFDKFGRLSGYEASLTLGSKEGEE